MTLESTLVSLARSRVVAQLKRCGCSILYTLVPKFVFILEKISEKLRPVPNGEADSLT